MSLHSHLASIPRVLSACIYDTMVSLLSFIPSYFLTTTSSTTQDLAAVRVYDYFPSTLSGSYIEDLFTSKIIANPGDVQYARVNGGERRLD